MSRITPVTPDRTDAATSDKLAAVKEKLGILPNLFTTLARSPASLDGYMLLQQALAGGQLSNRQRELIALAVAQDNQCEYCLSAHSAIAGGLGVDENTVSDARRGQAADPKDAAILSFALQVVRTRGGVDNADLEAARKALGDDGLVIEIVANVALNVLTNYVNRVADTEVDFPRVELQSAA